MKICWTFAILDFSIHSNMPLRNYYTPKQKKSRRLLYRFLLRWFCISLLLFPHPQFNNNNNRIRQQLLEILFIFSFRYLCTIVACPNVAINRNFLFFFLPKQSFVLSCTLLYRPMEHYHWIDSAIFHSCNRSFVRSVNIYPSVCTHYTHTYNCYASVSDIDSISNVTK